MSFLMTHTHTYIQVDQQIFVKCLYMPGSELGDASRKIQITCRPYPQGADFPCWLFLSLLVILFLIFPINATLTPIGDGGGDVKMRSQRDEMEACMKTMTPHEQGWKANV